MPRTNASVGLDMGLKLLVTTSDGETYDTICIEDLGVKQMEEKKKGGMTL